MTEVKQYKTLAFDCFGTLAFIAKPTHPYKTLLSRRTLAHKDPRSVMCAPWTLQQTALEFDIDISSRDMSVLEQALRDELASITLYPETRSVLESLRAAGYQIAVCSNLAAPYAETIEQELGDLLDVIIWSFNTGAVKPSSKIYEDLLHKSASAPKQSLMVGDSYTADVEGARAAGLDALHLVRGTQPTNPDQIASLGLLLERLC